MALDKTAGSIDSRASDEPMPNQDHAAFLGQALQRIFTESSAANLHRLAWFESPVCQPN
jgi:hypothetical protein